MTAFVRKAVAEDIPHLAVMVEASSRRAFLHILGTAGLEQRPVSYFVERFHNELDAISVMCGGSGSIVGMASVRQGILDMLFLDPVMTGRGLGHTLLRAAERRGAHTLSCFAANEMALRFYASSGWHITRTYIRPFCGAPRAFHELRKLQPAGSRTSTMKSYRSPR